MRLAGKTAIVTGSTRGIGHAVALAYAREGANVVVNGTREEVVNEVVAAIRDAGGKAAPCACGIGTRASADRLVDTALEHFGGLHILVNNAAQTKSAKLHELTEEDFDEVIRVNLKGNFLTAQAAVARVMREQQYGKIINVISHAGFRGAPGSTPYVASKMGLLGMTLSWANELAGSRINVNAIAPAALTDMMAALPPKRLENLEREFSRTNVLQRMPQPEDVVGSFVFLASDDSAFLTGQVLQANGQPMHVL